MPFSFSLSKNLCLSLLVLLLLFVTAFFLPSLGFAKPVALNVVVADEISISSSTSQILERLFHDKLPNTEFRRVVVDGQSPLYPHLSSDQAEVHAELKKKLASALQPGDTLTYLIIDTHGDTEPMHSAGGGVAVASEKFTRLFHLGDVSASQGVSPEFADLFDQLKPYVSSDLKIIINACSVFADGETAGSLRAQALLKYFGAVNGTVYGASIPEIDTFAFSSYGTWRDFLPTKKVFWINNTISLVMSATLALVVAKTHDGNPWVYGVSSFAILQALGYLRPLLNKTYDYFKLVNLGYLFRFADGKLASTEFMQKMKDLNRSFALPGKCKSTFL
jgi:hypothetical protein